MIEVDGVKLRTEREWEKAHRHVLARERNKGVTRERGASADYYYCPPWHVRFDPGLAAELLDTGPREVDRLPDGRPYDGRPWW